MLSKPKEHEQAIYLRKQGKSYSEIISIVPVSQSTLSLWLRDIKLTKKQIDQLSLKRKQGQSKGGLAKRNFRERQQKILIYEAAKQIKKLSRKELWLMGTVAYWCEGAKQKENNVSQGVVFVNSDPFLLKLFLKWLREICIINEDEITYSLYIHINADQQSAIAYWSKILNISTVRLGKPILKKHNIFTKRKNIGNNYHGLIRVTVKRSTNLNRKISGWIFGIGNFVS